MTDGTVPVSEMGIGDDDVEATLDEHAEIIRSLDHAVVDVDVKTDILAGVAHVHVHQSATLSKVPSELQNYIIAEGLHMFDPARDDDGTLSYRLTTGEIYETWGGMETPEF